MVIGLIQTALLMACERTENLSPAETGSSTPVSLGAVGERTASDQEASPQAAAVDRGSRSMAFGLTDRLIVRTGQASIEVDSLEPSMVELRRIVQRVGGFVADAWVQSGRNQLRSATLELKVPASRF
jgi:hypothetical protein